MDGGILVIRPSTKVKDEGREGPGPRLETSRLRLRLRLERERKLGESGVISVIDRRIGERRKGYTNFSDSFFFTRKKRLGKTELEDSEEFLGREVGTGETGESLQIQWKELIEM